VVLDEWPWLKPYIEIEGPSEAEVKDVVERLGLDWADGVFGDVMYVYAREYDIDPKLTQLSVLPSVKFGDPLPEILKVRDA
jgi:adenylate cyclase class 2